MSTTTAIEIGTTVKTRFGWMGEVQALDCALALVVDMDDDGRTMHTAWERLSALEVIDLTIPENPVLAGALQADLVAVERMSANDLRRLADSLGRYDVVTVVVSHRLAPLAFAAHLDA